MFFTSPKKTFGLDISDLSIKAVEIDGPMHKKNIRAIGSIKIPAGAIVDGVITDSTKVTTQLKKLLASAVKGINSPYAVVALPETKTFIKVISVDIDTEKTWDNATLINRELPKHIPAAISEMLIDWREISSSRQKKTFLVGAAEKQIAEDYYHVCQMAGIEPVALEIEAEAIIRAINHPATHRQTNWLKRFIAKQKNIFPKNPNTSTARINNQPKMILDLGANRMSLILVENNTIHFTRSFKHLAGRALTEQIMQKMHLPFADAEKAKVICGTDPKKCKGAVAEVMSQMIDDLTKEILSGSDYYREQFGRDEGELEVLLCGGGANMNNLSQTLSSALRRPVAVANPLADIKKYYHHDLNNLLSYTTAIGLALRNYA